MIFAKYLKRRKSRGFTLAEMLITIAIFIIVTTIVLASYRKFGQGVLTSNLAYEIALSFREAQVYGMSVKESNRAAVNSYQSGYGIDFTVPSSGSVVSYLLFSDNVVFNNPRDYLYEGGSFVPCASASECVKVYTISKNSKILKFCGVLADDANIDPIANDDNKDEECNTQSIPSSNQTISYLDVVFTRPNPEASIKSSAGSIYKSARIYVSSYTSKIKKVVEVWNNGQIAVR